MKIALAALAGYLLGNIQFAVIFSHLRHHDDVRRYGSGNPGSTNMLRVYGVRDGALTFAGDLLKGVAGVAIGRALGGETAACAAALGVILGHDFPMFFGFRGGKGVASSLGIVWALNPVWGAAVTAIAGAVVLATRIISMASMTGAAAFLVIALIWGGDVYIKLLSAAMFLLILLRHRENIARLKNGTESRVSFKSKDKQAD